MQRIVLAVIGAGLGVAGVAIGVVTAPDADAPSARTVDLAAPAHACPDGEEVGRLHADDRVLLTGRDAGGDWVEVRAPEDPAGRVWVRAAHVRPDADVDTLPQRPCVDEPAELLLAGADADEAVVEAPADDDEPDEEAEPDEDADEGEDPSSDATPEAPDPGEGRPDDAGPEEPVSAAPGTGAPRDQPRPSPSPGPGTPTDPPDPTPPPGPAPPPPAAPTIGALSRSEGQITEQDGPVTCPPGTPRTSQARAEVTAPAGVKSVTLTYTFAGLNGPQTVNRTMSSSGGLYRADIGPVAADTIDWQVKVVPIAWSVRVVDQLDRHATKTATGGAGVTLRSVWECFG